MYIYLFIYINKKESIVSILPATSRSKPATAVRLSGAPSTLSGYHKEGRLGALTADLSLSLCLSLVLTCFPAKHRISPPPGLFS